MGSTAFGNVCLFTITHFLLCHTRSSGVGDPLFTSAPLAFSISYGCQILKDLFTFTLSFFPFIPLVYTLFSSPIFLPLTCAHALVFTLSLLSFIFLSFFLLFSLSFCFILPSLSFTLSALPFSPFLVYRPLSLVFTLLSYDLSNLFLLSFFLLFPSAPSLSFYPTSFIHSLFLSFFHILFLSFPLSNLMLLPPPLYCTFSTSLSNSRSISLYLFCFLSRWSNGHIILKVRFSYDHHS